MSSTSLIGRPTPVLDEVFSHLAGDDLARPMAAAARIGHLHLHVAEIEPAVGFYEAVGFTRGVILPMGMAEMSAGGSFPHRLALNIWQGAGAPPPPDGAAGLRHAVLRLRSPLELKAAVERVQALGAEVRERDHGALIVDPSGNRMHLTTELAEG